MRTTARSVSIFVLCLSVCFVSLTVARDCFAQTPIDGDEPALEEVEEVQQFARLFVRRMQETRDLTPLVGELIATDFAVPDKQDFFERIDPALYVKLSRADKVRWEIAQWNAVYIMNLALTCSTVERPYDDSQNVYLEFLPADVAARLEEMETTLDESKLKEYEIFRQRLNDYEHVLAEARRHLALINLEGAACFQKRLADAENNLGANIDYRVRHYTIDEEEQKDELVGVTKVYRVDTPLFLGLIVIRDKDTGRLKIIAFDVGDGD